MESSWSLPARFGEIARARRAVRGRMTALAAPEGAIGLAEIATGELLANAVDHGSGRDVHVSLRVCADAAVVAVTNKGRVFARHHTDLASMLLEERGRGLAILDACGCAVSVNCPGTDRCTVTATIPFHRAVGIQA